MITAYIYKDKSKVRFSTVKLDLLPEKVVFNFKNKSFCITKYEILEYFILNNKITLKMKNIGIRPPVVVIIETIKITDLNIIESHLKSCIDEKNNKTTLNPIFGNK